MATGNKHKATREARERTRVYAARAQMHRDGARRRVRDNWVAAVVATLIVAGAIAGQAIYFTAGPGAPEPSPAPTMPAPSLPNEPPTEE